MSAREENEIPLLTDIVDDAGDSQSEPAADEDDAMGSTIPDLETVIAELQTRIASQTFALTDDLMRTAFAEIEANVFRQISSRLRQQLPELIDSVLREHLEQQRQDSDDET